MIVVHEKVKKLDFRLAPGVLSVQHVIFGGSPYRLDAVSALTAFDRVSS